MPYLGRRWRPLIALAIWLAGLLLYLALGYWNVERSSEEYNARLVGEAGQLAAQLAALLSLPAWDLDDLSAHIVVAGAMEDERIYAISIHGPSGLLDGQRRNYLWEPVPWDGELTENCVQGIAPIRSGGQIAGRVEIWLSPRLGGEELAILRGRELWRFFLVAFFWTGAFLALLWSWGDLRRMVRDFRNGKNPACPGEFEDGILLGLGKREPNVIGDRQGSKPARLPQARNSIRTRTEISPPMGASLFMHVFRNAPLLIDQLYAAGAWAQLCHVARLIEQGAPLAASAELAALAREMQNSLNDPRSESAASATDRLCSELKNVLSALEDEAGVK